MADNGRQLLTIGTVLIAIVVVLLLVPVIGWVLGVPVFLLICGLWLLVLAAMRSSKSSKYERSSFSTMSLGLILIATGGAWSLLTFGTNWIYSLSLILLVIAAIAITAALKRK